MPWSWYDLRQNHKRYRWHQISSLFFMKNVKKWQEIRLTGFHLHSLNYDNALNGKQELTKCHPKTKACSVSQQNFENTRIVSGNYDLLWPAAMASTLADMRSCRPGSIEVHHIWAPQDEIREISARFHLDLDTLVREQDQDGIRTSMYVRTCM